MTPDKLEESGWTVVRGNDGTWAAIRDGNPIVVYGLADGRVVYAVPEAPKPKVVRGFQPLPN